jgi:hypothetical protein
MSAQHKKRPCSFFHFYQIDEKVGIAVTAAMDSATQTLAGAAHAGFACADLDLTAVTARTASPPALEFCFPTSVSRTEQTRIFGASSLLLRCSRATSTAEKSGPSRQIRGVYRPVSLGSKKSVQSRKVAPPCRAVVECAPRNAALSTDTPSSCFCLSSSA